MPTGNRAPISPIDVRGCGLSAFETPVPGVWHASSRYRQESALSDFMLRLGATLGRVVSPCGGEPVQRLVPRDRSEAPPHSLSGIFGKDAFPLHTDLANSLRPPRFVILGAANASPFSARTTFVVIPDLNSNDFSRIAEGIFEVRDGRRSFLGSICERNRPFFRFDAACMCPVDERSRLAQCLFRELARAEPSFADLAWTRGDVAIIDNWNVLHGRSAVLHAHDNRLLLRLYVEASA